MSKHRKPGRWKTTLAVYFFLATLCFMVGMGGVVWMFETK